MNRNNKPTHLLVVSLSSVDANVVGILCFIGHIRKAYAKVRILETTILQLQLKAGINAEEQSISPSLQQTRYSQWLQTISAVYNIRHTHHGVTVQQCFVRGGGTQRILQRGFRRAFPRRRLVGDRLHRV